MATTARRLLSPASLNNSNRTAAEAIEANSSSSAVAGENDENETFREEDEPDGDPEQDQVTGSPKPARTKGFVLCAGNSVKKADEQGGLRFVPERKRNTVSRLDDETDEWGEAERASESEELMLFLKDRQMKDTLLSRLNTFRRNRAFCDVVLFVDGRELLAHKAVLAAISPSLFDMFLGLNENEGAEPTPSTQQQEAEDLYFVQNNQHDSKSISGEQLQNSSHNGAGAHNQQQQNQNKTTSASGEQQLAYFEFSHGDFDSLEAIVEFAYTAKLRVGSRRVKQLYRTSFALQVTPVMLACAHWLAEHLSVGNCIGIRYQANINEDSMLIARADQFIRSHFELVVVDSVEFSQLPCIKARVIVPKSSSQSMPSNYGNGGGIAADQPSSVVAAKPFFQPSGEELAQHCVRYFQQCPRTADRVDLQIEAWTEKTHLLVMGSSEHKQQQESGGGSGGSIGAAGQQLLQDANALDERTTLGACELIREYKKNNAANKSGNKRKPPQPELSQGHQHHHVSGATEVQMVKIGSAKKPVLLSQNNKFASRESLCSLKSCCSSSTVSTSATGAGGGLLPAEEDPNLAEADTRLLAVLPTGPGFWVGLAVLFHRLVRISVHLSEDEELIRSSRTSSVASSISVDGTTDLDAEQSTLTGQTAMATAFALMEEREKQQQQNQQNEQNATVVHRERSLLPEMCEDRCAMGASFIDGKLIVCGGYNRNICLRSAEQLDTKATAEGWEHLSPMRRERGRFDAAVVNGKMYAVCGSNGTNDLSSCEYYDPTTGRWQEVQSLEPARSHNGCASLADRLYSLGGCADQHVLAECASYEPASDCWTRIAPLNTQRSQAGCTAWRGMVVSVGGCDRWTCLDSVEAYDPVSDQWHFLAKLRTPRRGCAVAVRDNFLYVIGGHDGHSALTTVEVLDSPNGQWRPGPPLTMPRVHHHAVSTATVCGENGDNKERGSIYVVGGFNGTQFSASVEVLDNEKIGWRNWRQSAAGEALAVTQYQQRQMDDNNTDNSTQGKERMPHHTAAGNNDQQEEDERTAKEEEEREPETTSTTPTPRA